MSEGCRKYALQFGRHFDALEGMGRGGLICRLAYHQMVGIGHGVHQRFHISQLKIITNLFQDATIAAACGTEGLGLLSVIVEAEEEAVADEQIFFAIIAFYRLGQIQPHTVELPAVCFVSLAERIKQFQQLFVDRDAAPLVGNLRSLRHSVLVGLACPLVLECVIVDELITQGVAHRIDQRVAPQPHLFRGIGEIERLAIAGTIANGEERIVVIEGNLLAEGIQLRIAVGVPREIHLPPAHQRVLFHLLIVLTGRDDYRRQHRQG